MVSVYFGFDKKANLLVDYYFDNTFDENWFDDPVVKEMVLDIDNTVVESKYCMRSPVLGQIPPQMLSGGVKGLILLYKTNDFYTDIIIFGENCQKWLSKIFEMKDVRIADSGYDLTFRGYPIHGICENDNSVINNAEDWTMKQFDMAGEPENER